MDNNIITLINKINDAWKRKRSLYGVEYNEDKGYIAFRNNIFNMRKSCLI